MTPGKLDAALVRRHLLALDEAVMTLRKHRGRPVDHLRENREELWILERGLQLCAQNVLDIATHLAASAGRDVPSYGIALDQLATLSILPPDFVSQFRGIAGLRNILVHAYLDVDVFIIHELLENRLEDFAEFARRVNVHLVSMEQG